MDFEQQPQFENSSVPEYTYTAAPQEPIAPPKQKKKRPVLRGILLTLLILLAVAGGIYSLYRTYLDLNIRVDRSDNGFSISIGGDRDAPVPSEAPAPIPETAAPDEKTAAAAPHGDARLNISDSPASAPNYAAAQDGALSLQEIYEKMIPSVVSIVTNNGSGTGIIMSEDGYIITNYHVISNAYEIAVMLNSEQSYPAALVGGDEASDLAVLKISAQEPLSPAEFGNSDRLRVGDSVVAIGDPLGTKLRGTMTNGIISAINRDLFVNDREMTLIQTNAALNSGNSGGPLINCYGQVIGINAVKLSSSYFTASVEGLGFAIPISSAKPIVDELIANGYVSGRPAIGISGESLPMAVRVYYNLPEGVYVTYVDPDSDAYAKGIREGDIITAVNGSTISSIDELDSVKNQYTAGDTLTLRVFSGGISQEITVTLMDAALSQTN